MFLVIVTELSVVIMMAVVSVLRMIFVAASACLVLINFNNNLTATHTLLYYNLFIICNICNIESLILDNMAIYVNLSLNIISVRQHPKILINIHIRRVFKSIMIFIKWTSNPTQNNNSSHNPKHPNTQPIKSILTNRTCKYFPNINSS